jgi:translation initiation factor 1
MSKNKVTYREFGTSDNSAAMERTTPDLPPQQQNIRVQATRSGRRGKTVTLITGFQCQPATLNQLLKQLKTQCGSGGTAKENTLEIQGDHRQKIFQFLSDLGYKAKISGS